jgi:hypothetical protein
MNGLGRPLIILGLMLVAAGLVLSFAPRIPFLGKLPGDITIKREHFSFYFPLATCILISAAVSFILWLIRK